MLISLYNNGPVAWWAVRRYEHSYWAAWVRKKVTNRIER